MAPQIPSEDEVVANLRASLLSSKTPLRIQDVNTDYKLVNGYSIPFKEFGCKSLEEYLTKLKDRNEITMKYEGGNLLVHAAPKGESAHISLLVSKQKSAKKRSVRGGFRGGHRGRGGRGGGYGSRSAYRAPSYSQSSYRPTPPPPRSQSYANSFNNTSKKTREWVPAKPSVNSRLLIAQEKVPDVPQPVSLSGHKAPDALSSVNLSGDKAPSSRNLSSSIVRDPRKFRFGRFVHSELSRHNMGLSSTTGENINEETRLSQLGVEKHDYSNDYCEIVAHDDDVEIIAELKKPARQRSQYQNSSSTLPPRLQKRLGPQIKDDYEESRNSHSSFHDENQRVTNGTNEWEDRVVTYDSSPPTKSVDRASTRSNRNASAQSAPLKSETLAPRFQKQIDDKQTNGNSAIYDSSIWDTSSKPSTEDSEISSTSDKSSSVTTKTTRGPGAILARAKAEKAEIQANMQAQNVQQLAQTYLPGNTNNQSAVPGYQNGQPMRLGQHPAMSGLPLQGLNYNALGMFPHQNLQPLTVAPNLNNFGALNPVSQLYHVNPGQPSFIALPQTTPNFQYPVNSPQINPVLAMNGANANSSSVPNSNLAKPISGVSTKSATPAQDRLKKLNPPVNPDPKIPLPASYSTMSENASTPIDDLQNLANSMSSMRVNDGQISDLANSQINPESDPSSSPDSHFEKLFRLAERHKLPEPVYKTISRFCKIERKTFYVSVVTLDPNKKYSCTPEEFPSAAEAEEAAAKSAYLDLSKKMCTASTRRLKPHKTANSYILASRIAFLVESSTNGIWSEEIPNMYVTQYNEALADDWIQLISKEDKVDITHVGGRTIIASKQTSSNKFRSPPPFDPPESDFWDVYVTLPQSTAEVWVRLIGDNYSEQYENLVDQMELSYGDQKPEDCVMVPEVGNYYAMRFEKIWLRVKLVELKDNVCVCHLIDNGDTDSFSPKELFTLDPVFLKLPAQAVKCSLHGLEKYANDPSSQAYLNMITGSSFVAQVKSRKEPYSIELYDTSSDDNVHMGEELLQKFDAENSAPVMPQVGSIQRDVKTYVSHISDSGDIFLQFHTNHFRILLNLIEEITPEVEKANVIKNLSDIDQEKFYLAKFSDEEWYRAVVTNIISEEEIHVFYIDYGNTYSVPMSDLLCLDKLSTFLSHIRPQAILVNLDSVPPSSFSEKMAEKIRELVPDDAEVLVKKMTDDEPPKVEIFIRMGPNNVLASINNTILVDPELSKLAEKTEVNDGPKKNIEETASKNEDFNLMSSIRSSESGTPIGVVTPLVNTNLKVDAKPFIPKTSSTAQTNGKLDEKPIPAESSDSTFGLNPTDLCPFELPASEDGIFDVFVVNVANPYNFTIQSEDSKKMQEQLEKEMSNFYNKYNSMSKKKDIDIGETCAVKHTDGKWYRFTVTSLVSEHCIGGFPDTGGYQMVPLQDIYPLMPTYKSKPVLAIRAKLAGIRPKCKDWDVTDTLQFHGMVHDKKLRCRVVLKAKNQLELELFDCNGPLQKDIAQQLINNNCAVRMF